ncbi:DUF3368 domain-containing protein [Spirulina major]|uniref:DUF3368 domain-containing protein n=1 Tax=Spirulina major TaxID=270636 RepID=UPI000933E2A3|nr:DUF3368 domain-containing protein [Spirulina major]
MIVDWTLAEEQQAAQLLINEQAARRVARSRNLPLIGTMGILVLAKRQGLLQSVKTVLDAMRKQGTWISERLHSGFHKIAVHRSPSIPLKKGEVAFSSFRNPLYQQIVALAQEE